jgi:hypothetical protein
MELSKTSSVLNRHITGLNVWVQEWGVVSMTIKYVRSFGDLTPTIDHPLNRYLALRQPGRQSSYTSVEYMFRTLLSSLVVSI